MRNLYADLGLPPCEPSPALIRAALGRVGLEADLRGAADEILLEPERKARHDWVLRSALELASVRARLGLPPDPVLPPDMDPPSSSETGPDKARGAWPHPLWWLAGALALVLGGTAYWAGVADAEKAASAPAPVPSPATSSPEPAAPFRDPGPAPPPGAKAHDPRLLYPGLPAVETPAHGWTRLENSYDLRIPWVVETAPGQDYFISLQEVQTGQVVVMLYLRGGQPFRGAAPAGEFELSVSSGYHWYGLEQRFGPGTHTESSGAPLRLAPELLPGGVWELSLRPVTETRGGPPPRN